MLEGPNGNGYAVQFDRTIGSFLVCRWEGDQEGMSRWDHDPQNIDLRNEQSALHPYTVTVDGGGGELVLEVDGREILRQDVSDVSGTFGMRNWFDTTVGYDDVTLIVR